MKRIIKWLPCCLLAVLCFGCSDSSETPGDRHTDYCEFLEVCPNTVSDQTRAACLAEMDTPEWAERMAACEEPLKAMYACVTSHTCKEWHNQSETYKKCDKDIPVEEQSDKCKKAQYEGRLCGTEMDAAKACQAKLPPQ